MLIKYTLIAVAIIFNLNITLYAFRDISSETGDAAEEFIDSGLYDKFIFRYGDSYFRPDGNVTRDELLLVLRENYTVFERLLEQNSYILSKLREVENRDLSSSELDSIVRAVQRNLESMLRASPTLKSLKDEIQAVPEYDAEELQDIKKEVNYLQWRLGEVEKEFMQAEKEKLSRPGSLRKDKDILFPSWGKLSIGFSALTLFFMSR